MIPTKNSSWENRFSQNTQRTHRVPPAGPHTFVADQSHPILAGPVLIQSDADAVQLILLQVFRQGNFRLQTNVVIVDTPVPQDQLGWDANDPTDPVDKGTRFATLDLGSIVQDLWRPVRIGQWNFSRCQRMRLTA
jgi:hypothetical protein